jgi:cobalamin biosynthesis Mg chelatase CobN
VFEPRIDPNVLYAQLFVLAAAAGAGAFWWYSLVPTLRRNLAKEKRSGGEVNKYLVEIQSDESRAVERWFYTDWLQQLRQRQQLAAQAAAKRAAAAAAAAGVTPQKATAATQQQNASLAASRLAGPASAASAVGHSSTSTQSQPTTAAAGEQQQEQQQQQQQQAEEQEDKVPSFWSLDNPILATAAALSVLTLASVVLHR